MRIVVLGGGFGGVTTARHLERRLRRQRDVEITLVSRENFFVLTPLLFEACSGRLELRHCAQPIRTTLRRTRFIEATVDRVDVERQVVRVVSPAGAGYDLPYDHLVVALGASTNERLIAGSSNAFTFKTMADALVLRNHIIEQFERADAASETTTRRGCLTIVVIGGGLVGVELLGELTAFVEDVLRFYPRIRRDEIRFLLFEAGARLLPELDETLAAIAADVLRRRGAEIHVSTAVQSIEPTVLTRDEAGLLDVPELSPALLFERLTSDASGRPVEYVHSIYRGDRYRIVSRLALGPRSGRPSPGDGHHPGIPPGDSLPGEPVTFSTRGVVAGGLFGQSGGHGEGDPVT